MPITSLVVDLLLCAMTDFVPHTLLGIPVVIVIAFGFYTAIRALRSPIRRFRNRHQRHC